MDLSVPEDAATFGASARRALAPHSDSMPRAEHLHDPATRTAIEQTLSSLGAWELDLAGSLEEMVCAALLAQETGRIAAPVATAARLTASWAGLEGSLHATHRLTAGARILVDHVATEGPIWLVDLDGRFAPATRQSGERPTRLMAPAAGFVEVGPLRDGDTTWWAVHETLSAYGSVGAAEAAVDAMTTHLQTREQFGRPLAQFQALQHRHADALRHLIGLRDLAQNTLWRVHTRAGSPTTDALVVRAYHLEATREIFRHAHQVHGAIGFCYEHPIAVLSMWTQFRRNAPSTLPQTLAALAPRLGEVDMIFGPDEHSTGLAEVS